MMIKKGAVFMGVEKALFLTFRLDERGNELSKVN